MLFQAHTEAYNAINMQTDLDRNGNEVAADDKRNVMDLMVSFISKENLPVRIVESKHLMKLLQGKQCTHWSILLFALNVFFLI